MRSTHSSAVSESVYLPDIKSQPNSLAISNLESLSNSEVLSKTQPPKLLPLDDRLDVAMRAAVDQRGLDVRALNVSRATDIADRFLFISGTSERHVKGIADKIVAALGNVGDRPNTVSGYEKGEWVLLDFGDLLVHIFYEPTRQYYNIEELWSNRASLVSPAPDLERAVKSLRTGISW